MGKTAFGFLLGFATAVGVAYAAYRALIALPDIEGGERKVELRRTH
ncbi:MAG: hypothetical protein ABR562_02165 [Thermoplasmatota archaeon]